MPRKKRSVSDSYLNKLNAIATKVLDEWGETPSSYAECDIQKITIERWQKGENLPSVRSFEGFLRFLRLTQKRWDEYLDDKIDFDTFWALRGKELEDRVITWESIVNDARTLTQEERMLIVGELAKINTNNTEKAPLVSLTLNQLKHLRSLLVLSRASLGDNDEQLKTFENLIDQGVSQSLITSILDQKATGFPKKEFEVLAKFLLMPSRWVGDNLIGVTNQRIASFGELIKALES